MNEIVVRDEYTGFAHYSLTDIGLECEFVPLHGWRYDQAWAFAYAPESDAAIPF
jgi:hypothetical protein